MEKLAKNPPDPAQLALRNRKKVWNKAVSQVIDRFFAFKDALNGKGSLEYGLPKSNIKNPIPSEIVSFLAELSSNFQQLALEASHIIQEQAHYSETRKKPMKKVKSPQLQPNQGPKVATASAAKKGKVIIGNNIFPTELALTATEQQRGLMWEEQPKIMAFPHPFPSIQKMWMHNTPRDLDIVFALDGTIINICHGEAYSTKLIGTDHPSNLIVELPHGYCDKYGIGVGDPVNLIY